ncbi:MAG: hypothetical protein J6Z11_11235, partial [Candidatus Riflebacteria bacterium]|nr:hypothetical protein [Candidatus Riflebacteria bacterium]
KTNLIILLTAHSVDEDHKNTVTSKAIKELNEIKPLRYSETIEEISKPTVDGPDVYGKDIIWPKPVEETETTTNTTSSNKKIIRSSKMVVGEIEEKPATKVKKVKKEIKETADVSDTTKANTTNKQTRENTETEKYLMKKLKEIRENRNNYLIST